MPSQMNPGEVVADRYRIERELGRGGMAVVYLALDAKHDRRVALKVLSDELSSIVGEERFRQEIKLTASLQHPHILPAYDSGVTGDGTLFYVMPYVEGASLRKRLLEQEQLPLADALQVTREVANGLAFAHDHGIVHRDIKPENILFLGGHALIADFGIARLISAETQERLTIQGAIVGTPQYMSPEQGLAMPVDARSDVYSLACVVYEMLTGSVPFVGEGAGVWVGNRLQRTPAPVRLHRPEAPEALDTALIRALATSPTERFATMREFAEAVEQSVLPQERRPQPDVRRAWRGGILAGAAIALVALIGTAALSTSWLRDAAISLGVVSLDSNRALMAPIQSGAPAGVPMSAIDARLREELERWGVQVLSPAATSDAIGSADALTIDRALNAARQSRAGLMVWTRAEEDSGRVRVEAQLYDARTMTNRTESAALLSTGSPAAIERAATELAARLLAGADAPAAALRAAGSTRSLRAWRAYVDGQRALDNWQLAAAESAFTVSAMADPQFPQPRAWLGQVRLWGRRADPAALRQLSEEALMLAGKLDTADLLIAQAVGAFGNRNEPVACAQYRTLLRRDSLNAGAWLGVGDCHSLDRTVVPDSRSRSGYSFRGSLSTAMSAYERAVRLEPSAHVALPFAHVENVLPTRTERYREGRLAGNAARLFAARPFLDADTIAYVPRPIIANTLPPDPPNFEEALARNQARLLEYVSAWVQRVPSSADAYEALAAVQEARAELAARPGTTPSALEALDSATTRTDDRGARARLAASRVRVHLKLGAFARVSALADSILRIAQPTPEEAHRFAGVAAVAGRLSDAARLARLGNTPPVDMLDTMPPALADPAAMLLLRAAAGACDNIARDLASLEGQTDGYIAPAYRDAVRHMLTQRARYLAVQCTGIQTIASAPARSPWERMYHQVAAGDTLAVRAGFDTLLSSRRYRRAGSIAIDYTVHEAWLLSAIGDTTGAIRQLDLTLEALPSLNPHAVWELGQAAAVGRAMAWRAELAHSRGDVQNASRWARGVLDLWKNADPALEPRKARIRAIAGAN